MSDETRRVLELLAEGKVTVEEAEQLLRALAAPDPVAAADAGTERPKPRYLRITVHKPSHEGGKDKDVNIRVPITVVKSGMRLGALIPGFARANDKVAARLRERGLDVIDFSKLDPADLEKVLQELGETNIDIDAGKAQVRISCE